MPSRDIAGFIAHWSAATPSERANSQAFLLELLGVDMQVSDDLHRGSKSLTIHAARNQVSKMIARGIRQLVALLFLAGILAGLHAGWQATRTQTESMGDGVIMPDAARRFPAGSVQFVDARSQDEYTRGHPPGAVLLNTAAWESLLAGFYDAWEPGKNVIVYGRARSDEPATVARRLRVESKLENVFVLKGIWEEWPRK